MRSTTTARTFSHFTVRLRAIFTFRRTTTRGWRLCWPMKEDELAFNPAIETLFAARGAMKIALYSCRFWFFPRPFLFCCLRFVINTVVNTHVRLLFPHRYTRLFWRPRFSSHRRQAFFLELRVTRLSPRVHTALSPSAH